MLVNARKMAETLNGASEQFAEYERQHLAKPVPDIAKVRNNTFWKNKCSEAAKLPIDSIKEDIRAILEIAVESLHGELYDGNDVSKEREILARVMRVYDIYEIGNDRAVAPVEELPCPWCEGTNIGFVKVSNEHGKIYCWDCGAYGPAAHSAGDGDDERALAAIAAWNTRAIGLTEVELSARVTSLEAETITRLTAENDDLVRHNASVEKLKTND